MGLLCKDLVFLPIALLLVEALSTANGLLSVARLPAFAPALSPAHSQGRQFCSRAPLYIRALRTRSAPAERWSAYAKPEDSKANKVEQDKVEVDVEKVEAITELRRELIDVVKKVANALDRGFSASMSDREKLNEVLLQLAPYSPVTNPASALLSEIEPAGALPVCCASLSFGLQPIHFILAAAMVGARKFAGVNRFCVLRECTCLCLHPLHANSGMMQSDRL